MTLDDVPLSLFVYLPPSCDPVNKSASWIMDYTRPKQVLQGICRNIASFIGIT